MTLSHVVECRAGDSALRKGGGVDMRSPDDVKADHLGALHHDRDGQEKPRTEIARIRVPEATIDHGVGGHKIDFHTNTPIEDDIAQ